MPIHDVSSAQHKAMRTATANTLRTLADLIENGDEVIQRVNFNTIRDLPRLLNHTPVPELEQITYELEVVTWGLEQIRT